MRSPNSSEVSIPPTLGGGTLVTDRSALIIDISLRKHAAQLAFPGASRLTGCATRATFGLGLHHQHLRPIHLVCRRCLWYWKRNRCADQPYVRTVAANGRGTITKLAAHQALERPPVT